MVGWVFPPCRSPGYWTGASKVPKSQQAPPLTSILLRCPAALCWSFDLSKISAPEELRIFWTGTFLKLMDTRFRKGGFLFLAFGSSRKNFFIEKRGQIKMKCYTSLKCSLQHKNGGETVLEMEWLSGELSIIVREPEKWPRLHWCDPGLWRPTISST